MKKTKIVLILILFLLNLFLPVLAFTLQDEIAVGQEAAKKVEQQYKVLPDEKYQGRVNHIGKQLYDVCPKPEIPYTFKVIDSNVFNAFSLPGGPIYVTRELMDKSNDGELAFVLGHEMAHAAHSHSFKQAEKQSGTSLGLLAIVLILTRGNPTSGAMTTAGLANLVMNSSYSRADERQADLDALSYMGGAGYDPRYAVSSFEKMKSYGGGMPGILTGIVGDHPDTDERIKYVQERIPQTYYKPKDGNPFPPYGENIEGKSYLDRLNSNVGTTQRVVSETPKTLPAPPEPTPMEQINTTLEKSNKEFEEAQKAKDHIEEFKTYREIPFGNITREDLVKAPVLYNAEEVFYEYLKTQCSLKGALQRDRKLDNVSRQMSIKKTSRNITSKYVIYSDIIPANLDYYDYEDSFYKYDLPKVLRLNKSFDKIGLTFKLLPDDRKYVIIVFEYK